MPPSQDIRELILIEDVTGPRSSVTVVTFLVSEILDSEQIHNLGTQLYSLVEDGRTNILLDFGAVQLAATELLGKLLGLQKRIKNVNGNLVLCQISKKRNPVIDEAFEVCGLKKSFTICADQQEALQSRF